MGGAHLVDVNDPPAGVLAVGHDAEVDEVVGGVAVLPERVHRLDPAEPRLVPAAPIRDQRSVLWSSTNHKHSSSGPIRGEYCGQVSTNESSPVPLQHGPAAHLPQHGLERVQAHLLYLVQVHARLECYDAC